MSEIADCRRRCDGCGGGECRKNARVGKSRDTSAMRWTFCLLLFRIRRPDFYGKKSVALWRQPHQSEEVKVELFEHLHSDITLVHSFNPPPPPQKKGLRVCLTHRAPEVDRIESNYVEKVDAKKSRSNRCEKMHAQCSRFFQHGEGGKAAAVDSGDASAFLSE